MTIEELINYAKIIGPVLSAISIALGVYIFFINSKRSRTEKTLDFWEDINLKLRKDKQEIEKKYGSHINREQAEHLLDEDSESIKIKGVINTYERLALGVNLGVYDAKVINRLMGGALIRNYERFVEYIILHREKNIRPNAWTEFEHLVIKLKSVRNES